MALVPLSTLGPALSFASSVLEQFKPSRSPYLLAVSLGALFIGLVLDGKFDTDRKIFVVLPIYFIILVLSVLAFYFRPFEAKDLTEKPDAVDAEIDTQFKLARTTGLVVGIACLYMIAYRRLTVDGLYVILYGIILVHCLTYLIYIVF